MPKKYYPNNWKAIKEADDECFMIDDEGALPFDTFMDWKLNDWEFPSSVACIIKEHDKKTGKVKEHVYSKRAFAVKKINNLMDKGKEFTIVDEVQIHQMYPKDD